MSNASPVLVASFILPLKPAIFSGP